MKNNILLIGYNFKPELTGIGKYSGEMIHWLAEKGYQCTVITTYPYYPYWKVQKPYHKNRFWFKTEIEDFASGGRIKILRCPVYIPSKPTAGRRMLLDFTFLLSAFILTMFLFFTRKFGYVLTVAPSFQLGLLGILFKKFQNAKFLYHIQDMQIEAARDLNLIRSKTIINGLFKIENFILRHADCVSTVSKGMRKKIKEKFNDDVYLLANWADIDFFTPLKNKTQLKLEFGFKRTDKIILYSGAIGEKQGLELILNAAKEFEDVENLKFVICGSGPYKGKLIDIKNELGLKNLIFFPLQPMSEFNKFLNIADVHLVVQKSQAGDLVMPSKLTSIWAVGGLALVTANEDTELHRIMKKHEIGLVIKPDDQNALNEGIKNAVGFDWRDIANNARAYAVRKLSIDAILNSYEEFVLKSSIEEPIADLIGQLDSGMGIDNRVKVNA